MQRILIFCYLAIDAPRCYDDIDSKTSPHHTEAVTVCTSYTDAITAETVRTVREIAEAVRAGMDQDAVTIEIDGAAGFVERPAEQAAED